MATGYEQARSVVAALAGDMAAADDVQLALPQTGVCSSDLQTESQDAAAAACCTAEVAAAESTCCTVEKREEHVLTHASGCCGSSNARRPT